MERMLEMNEYEKKYADLWVQCQRCHESLHEAVICHKYEAAPLIDVARIVLISSSESRSRKI